MHNAVHKHRNEHTHGQMGLRVRCGEECIFIVPQQSLWLLGTRAGVKYHNDPSSVLSSSPTFSLFYIYHPPFPLSCVLLPSVLLLSPVSLSSPFFLALVSPSTCFLSSSLLSCPLTSLPRLPITSCLSVAQHSTSRLSLNIDRKVNDNTTQVVHTAEFRCKVKHRHTHTQRSYYLTCEKGLLCCQKTRSCYG